MNVSDRGTKHVCPECETRYYDLKKKVVTCPICGAEPPVRKVLKASAPVKKSGAVRFGRYS